MIFGAGANLLKMIVSAYTAGDINRGRAAEFMGVSHEEMKDILAEKASRSTWCHEPFGECCKTRPMPDNILDTTILSNLAAVGRLVLFEEHYRQLALTHRGQCHTDSS